MILRLLCVLGFSVGETAAVFAHLLYSACTGGLIVHSFSTRKSWALHMITVESCLVMEVSILHIQPVQHCNALDRLLIKHSYLWAGRTGNANATRNRAWNNKPGRNLWFEILPEYLFYLLLGGVSSTPIGQSREMSMQWSWFLTASIHSIFLNMSSILLSHQPCKDLLKMLQW